MKKIHAAILVIIAASLTVSAYLIIPKEIHEHADFAVYIHGERINFSQDKYMHHESAEEEKAHMHDNAGWIAHKHAAGATWKEFFAALEITFNSTCFVITNDNYCNNETHRLLMFVNEKEVFDLEKHEIKDLDRVLITFDKADTDFTAQLNNLTDEACLYSKRCPERGEAGSEGCVTAGKQCT